MPVGETLPKLNWIDIVVISLIFIASYRGFKKGIIVEMFKLLSIVLSIYISMHYFSVVSDLLYKYFPIAKLTLWDFISFTSLAVLAYFAVVVLRGIFLRFIKVEAAGSLNKWGGLLTGLLRGLLTVSMIILLFYFSTVGYLKESVQKSSLGSRCARIDVKVYECIFNNAASKFFPGDKLNQGIYEVLAE